MFLRYRCLNSLHAPVVHQSSLVAVDEDLREFESCTGFLKGLRKVVVGVFDFDGEGDAVEEVCAKEGGKVSVEVQNCHRFLREQFQNQHLRDSSHSRKFDIFFDGLLGRELIRDWLLLTAAAIFSSIDLDFFLFDVWWFIGSDSCFLLALGRED